MRNRRLLWCLGAGFLLAAAGFAVFVVVHVLPDRVTPENIERIKVGVTTEEEVRALLGGPPDLDSIGGTQVWVGERWIVSLNFDAGGRVVQWGYAEAAYTRAVSDLPLPEPPTFWQKLRRSLGW